MCEVSLFRNRGGPTQTPLAGCDGTALKEEIVLSSNSLDPLSLLSILKRND